MSRLLSLTHQCTILLQNVDLGIGNGARGYLVLDVFQVRALGPYPYCRNASRFLQIRAEIRSCLLRMIRGD